MRLSSLALSGVLATGLAQQVIVPDAQTACERLGSSFNAPHVTVNLAQYVPAGTNITLPEQGTGAASCMNTGQVVSVDLCRIAANVATSNRSEIFMEAWLPTNWTGRFLSTGNGGLSGCVKYDDLAYTASFGFAAVGANNGHNGTSGAPFLDNDDIVADFAYRSVHTGVVIGKAITKAYYEQDYTKSYYFGCSTGGRQGFKEAQDFPGDFDGIVAGAPALAFNNLSSWSGRGLYVTGPPSAPTFLTPQLWALVAKDVLAQCDGLDGVVDGIIEDNDLCPYRPENLQCSPNNSTTNSTTCLTAPQVQTVRTLFTDWHGTNGSIIYPRANYGAEIPMSMIYYTGLPFEYTTDWYRYAIYNNPNWSATTLTLADTAYASAKNPSNIETWNGDLSPFQKAGGKILHYHGQADPIITSDNSPRYYNHVSNTMQLPSRDLDEFYRFFRVSGMGHCSGGVGAWGIGQGAVVNGAEPTVQNNVLLRIVDWVENGNAPETVTGYKYINDTASLGVDFERNHCRYPLRNTCVDPENYKKPEAWKCV